MQNLVKQIVAGDRRAISKAITLVESQNDLEQKKAQELLEFLENIKKSKNNEKNIKLGISGPPGVGKSSLIEKLGLEILNLKNKKNNLNFKIAVLAIDPSSPNTKGSILGDKTRMQELSQNPNVYVRPSAAGEILGGVAYGTDNAVKILEAAGFDLVIIETVGVGQSEYAVSKLVDKYWVLVQPGSGDDLQSMKRGNMELADLIIINKADGVLREPADKIYSELLESYGSDRLIKISALEGLNIEGLPKSIFPK